MTSPHRDVESALFKKIKNRWGTESVTAHRGANRLLFGPNVESVLFKIFKTGGAMEGFGMASVPVEAMAMHCADHGCEGSSMFLDFR